MVSKLLPRSFEGTFGKNSLRLDFYDCLVAIEVLNFSRCSIFLKSFNDQRYTALRLL